LATYIQDIKVGKKNRILQYSWLSTGSSHKNLAIRIFLNLQNLANLGNFLHAKSFVYRWKSYFSGRNLSKFRPPNQKKKKKHCWQGSQALLINIKLATVVCGCSIVTKVLLQGLNPRHFIGLDEANLIISISKNGEKNP
jgi:hypothetical protein